MPGGRVPRRPVRVAPGRQTARSLGRAARRPVSRHVPDPEQVLRTRWARNRFPRQRLERQLGLGAEKVVAGLSMLAAAAYAAAQASYPEQPVRILVGFTAGVAPDVT